MGIATRLGNEMNDWVKLAMIIVISSLVLVKFKGVSGITAALNTTIDAFVTAFSEPANWVAIAIIALVGYGIMKYFTGKKK